MPFNPLGKGFLTGTVDTTTAFTKGDIRASIPRFDQHNLAANQAPIDHVATLARATNATPGQIALAWLLAQQPWIVPIPGTRRIERLEENAGSTQVALSVDDVADLDATGPASARTATATTTSTYASSANETTVSSSPTVR